QDTKYLKVRLNSIHPATPVPFDLYVLVNGKYIHYLRVGDSLAVQKIEKFERQAPDQFFLLSTERANYKKYIHDHMSSDKLSSAEKAVMLRESSLSLVEELFENPDVEKALTESRTMINEFISLMNEDPD